MIHIAFLTDGTHVRGQEEMIRSRLIGAAVGLVLIQLSCADPQAGEAASTGSRKLRVPGMSVYPCINNSGAVVPGCSVTKSFPDEHTTRYVITQPIVNESSTPYPMVGFLPGDTVTVTGFGCVQTNGVGSTWKAYVFPLPFEDGTSGRYHGTVGIPGVTSPDTPLYTIQGIPKTIPDLASTDPACSHSDPLYLTLGYTDDNYPDNGYANHDNGDLNQCANGTSWPYADNGAPAHLEIEVKSRTGGAFYDPVQPFDVVPACIDENSLFTAAHWGWQTLRFAPPSLDADNPATAQSTGYDNLNAAKELFSGWFATLGGGLVAIGSDLFFGNAALCDVDKGHRNWTDVTYSGRVKWDDHSSTFPLFGDDDYNINLCPPLFGPANFIEGGLRESRDRIQMEFDAGESIDLFTRHPQQTWWDLLRKAVDGDISRSPNEYLDGHFAIATGLIGSDAVHDADKGNELHPIHALAIHTGQAYNRASKTFRDQWAFFVRNFGDEGECSSLDHYLLLNHFTLRLPPRIEEAYASVINGGKAVSYSVLHGAGTTDFSSNKDFGNYGIVPGVDDLKRNDVIVTLPLLDPPLHSWYAGELEIEWSLSQDVPDTAFPEVVASTGYCKGGEVEGPPGAAKLVEDDEDAASEPERRAVALWNSLTPDQQSEYLTLYEANAPAPPFQFAALAQGAIISTKPSRPNLVPQTDVGPPTLYNLQRRVARIEALCAATGGTPPQGPPGVCARIPPTTLLEVKGGSPGLLGWLVSPATAVLEGYDASGTGIAFSEFRWNGDADFLRYSGPLSMPEGETRLTYRSQDNAGNVETAKSHPFKVDTRAPMSQGSVEPAGDDVAFHFFVNDPVPGSGPATLSLIFGGPDARSSTTVDASSPGTVTLPTRCSDVEYWGTDVAGNIETPHRHHPDSVAPVLTVTPQSTCLWPPNHVRVRFLVGRDFLADAHDDCDPAPRIKIVRVTSNEADTGGGSGDLAGDVAFSGSAVCLRRERDGTGSGRVYSVTFEASDSTGNTTERTVTVNVPHPDDATCSSSGEIIPEGAACE